MPKRSKTELAERLKETAGAAGLTAEQLAEKLGVSPAAVWAWWSGRNEPSLSTLVSYGEIVGRSLQYLATGNDQQTTHGETLADWVMAFADLLVGGEAPGSAFDQVTKSPHALSARERQSLSRRAAAMREFIETEAGRPWSDLTTAERRALAERLLQRADE